MKIFERKHDRFLNPRSMHDFLVQLGALVLTFWQTASPILLINYVAPSVTKCALKLLAASISRQRRELGSLMRSETT